MSTKLEGKTRHVLTLIFQKGKKQQIIVNQLYKAFQKQDNSF